MVNPSSTLPPTLTCELHYPVGSVWLESIAVFAVGSIAQLVICGLLSATPAASRPFVGGAVAVAYASIPFGLRSYLNSLSLSPVAWFILSSLGMTGFFKTLQGANGFLLPQGVANSFGNACQAFLAVPPMRWKNGKPQPAISGELAGRLAQFGARILGLAASLSVLLSPQSVEAAQGPPFFPLGTGSYVARLAAIYTQLWALYLFLALLFDVGMLVTLLGGTSAEEGFRAPLVQSRGFKEAWGERWNLVVHGFLKSCIYKPVRRIGLSPNVATVLSFLASGLLHEYMFAIHNARAYTPGYVCMFFVLMGFVMMIEEKLVKPFTPRMIAQPFSLVPTIVVATVLTFASCSLFDPLYMDSWRQAGMLESMANLVLTVRCRIAA